MSPLTNLGTAVSMPIAITSSSLKGTGLEPGPTNPVTPLVFLTTYQDSSVITILTSTYPGNTLRCLVFSFPVFVVSTTSSVGTTTDRKSTRLNSSHANISYAVFCLKKKKNN